MLFVIKNVSLKTLMMPMAMVFGAVFYKWMEYVTFLSPYLIFMMLFITYCKLTPKDFKPSKFELHLLIVQMTLAAICYGFVYFWNPVLAQGLFICVFIPTATAAPVITSMLGGSISKVASYSLMCNSFVALTAPIILAMIGDHPEMTFLNSFLLILKQVFPLIICPLVLAMIVRKYMPKLHSKILTRQSISFYLWVVALFIVVGSCVSFAIRNFTPQSALTMFLLAIGSLGVCLIQFKLGRKIGSKFGDAISGGQSLGQKNTVLAIWLALAYLEPMASIAPAAYIAWQNIINSWQIMRHQATKENMNVQPIN